MQKRNEVKKLLLRCIIKEQNGYFVGTCLELSVSAMGKNVSECKHELVKVIKSYLDSIFELHRNGERLVRTPVRFYFFKKLLFDCLYACSSVKFSGRAKPPNNAFIKEVVVPTGV